jgi:hypothetical protein
MNCLKGKRLVSMFGEKKKSEIPVKKSIEKKIKELFLSK